MGVPVVVRSLTHEITLLVPAPSWFCVGCSGFVWVSILVGSIEILSKVTQKNLFQYLKTPYYY